MMGRPRLWFSALTVVGTLGTIATFAGAGCSSTRSETGDASRVLAACGWPASLDRGADGAIGQCVAARTYLACTASDGSGENCLSDDPTQCPGPNPVIGVTFGSCRDLCKTNEYAVACGGVGPGPWPSPPAQCRTLPPGPGGGSVACCPCGSDAPRSDAAGDMSTTPIDASDPFDCGGTVTCDAASQVCQHVAGGVPPGVDLYSCSPIPTACAGDLSCACVAAALSPGAGRCTAAGAHLTVQIDVP
jgi:hypothetical protein